MFTLTDLDRFRLNLSTDETGFVTLEVHDPDGNWVAIDLAPGQARKLAAALTRAVK